MLAAQVPVFRQLFDSRRADRVIPSSIIQQTRLLPQHASQCRPTQMLLTPSRIHGSEEGLSVESRRRNHRILLLSILPLRLLLLLGIFRATIAILTGSEWHENGSSTRVKLSAYGAAMGLFRSFEFSFVAAGGDEGVPMPTLSFIGWVNLFRPNSKGGRHSDVRYS